MDNASRLTIATTSLTTLRYTLWVHTRVLLLAIWLLALGLRLSAALIIEGPPIDVSESGQTAAHMMAGQGYVFGFYGYRDMQPLHSFMPPLYTSIMAASMALTPANSGLTLKFLQAILSSLISLIIFRIGMELFDWRTAILSALGVALYPVFVIVVTQPTVTVVNTFLLSLLIWVLLQLRRDGKLSTAALAGFIVGLSALNRPLIIVFLLPIFGWLWLHRGHLHFHWWQLGLVISLVTVLTIAPWTIRNVAIHKAPVLISTNGGFTFWNGNNPFTTGSGFDVYADRLNAYLGQPPETKLYNTGDTQIIIMEPYPLPPAVRNNLNSLSEVELERALYQAGWEFIRSQPRQWLDLALAKTRALWWFRPNIGTYRDFYEGSWITPYKVIYAVLLTLALGGVLLTYREWRETILIYLLLGVMTLGYVVYNVITRYRWEFEPFLLLLASISISRLAGGVIAVNANRKMSNRE